MITKQDMKKIDSKIDELAIMIQSGFKHLESRIDSLEQSMDSLETRVYSLEDRINTMEFKLITAPNNRLDRIEDEIRGIKTKIGLV